MASPPRDWAEADAEKIDAKRPIATPKSLCIMVPSDWIELVIRERAAAGDMTMSSVLMDLLESSFTRKERSKLSIRRTPNAMVTETKRERKKRTNKKRLTKKEFLESLDNGKNES